MDYSLDKNFYSNIAIIGKGSKLFQSLFVPDYVEKFSTEESLNKESFDDKNLIVFSLLNEKGLMEISKKTSGTTLIVGSASCLSTIAGRFKYSSFKKKQLSVINQKDISLKYLIFGEFFPTHRKGLYFFSYKETFWINCFSALESEKKVFHFYETKGNKTSLFLAFSYLDRLLAPISTYFIKKFSNYTYGYTNAYLKK